MLDIPRNWQEIIDKRTRPRKMKQKLIDIRTNIKANNRHVVCKRLGKKIYPYRIFLGLKICTTCNVCYDTHDIFCPCCHHKLRIKCRTKRGTKSDPRPDDRPRI